MALENYFRTFTVQRPVEVEDGWNSTETYTDVAGTFRGFLQETSKVMVNENGVPLEQKSLRLYTPVDLDLRKGDKIDYTNVKYIVDAIGTPDGISGVGHHKELVLSRWDG